MKNLEKEQYNDISTYLNFAKKKNAIYFGIKSILRNKNKIKLLVKIKTDNYNDNLEKDIEYLKNNYNIKVCEIEKENIKNTTCIIQDNLRTIGISDVDLSNAVLKKVSSK